MCACFSIEPNVVHCKCKGIVSCHHKSPAWNNILGFKALPLFSVSIYCGKSIVTLKLNWGVPDQVNINNPLGFVPISFLNTPCTFWLHALLCGYKTSCPTCERRESSGENIFTKIEDPTKGSYRTLFCYVTSEKVARRYLFPLVDIGPYRR